MACVTSKCCFCAPLRPGLLLWAYIKLMLAVAFFVFAFFSYANVYHLAETKMLIHLWVVLGIGLVHIVLTVVFVIGMHHEDYKLLLAYYRYSMFEILLGVSAVGYQVSIMSSSGMAAYYYRRPSAIIQLVALVVGNIMLPVYFIILIRSELLKIKAREEELKTSVEDARVVLDVPIAREQDRKYDFVYSNPESQEVPKMSLFPVEELERLRQQLGVKRDV